VVLQWSHFGAIAAPGPLLPGHFALHQKPANRNRGRRSQCRVPAAAPWPYSHSLPGACKTRRRSGPTASAAPASHPCGASWAGYRPTWRVRPIPRRSASAAPSPPACSTSTTPTVCAPPPPPWPPPRRPIQRPSTNARCASG
jgi:hypothetical protein